MSEEKNPVMKPSLLAERKPVMIEFKQLEPLATGISKYGEWKLYPIEVTNCNVEKDGNTIEGYTGEAITFLNTSKLSIKLNKALEQGITTVMIETYPEKNKKGIYYPKFIVTTLEGQEIA